MSNFIKSKNMMFRFAFRASRACFAFEISLLFFIQCFSRAGFDCPEEITACRRLSSAMNTSIQSSREIFRSPLSPSGNDASSPKHEFERPSIRPRTAQRVESSRCMDVTSSVTPPGGIDRVRPWLARLLSRQKQRAQVPMLQLIRGPPLQSKEAVPCGYALG